MKREQLILARQRKGLTQTGLAKAIGVTQTTVSKYEAGLASPSEATWKKIAALLKKRVETLWELTD
jgi:DNA-binding XRE family transcriptional regulator